MKITRMTWIRPSYEERRWTTEKAGKDWVRQTTSTLKTWTIYMYRLYEVRLLVISQLTDFENQYRLEIFKFRIYFKEENCLRVLMSLNPEIQTFTMPPSILFRLKWTVRQFMSSLVLFHFPLFYDFFIAPFFKNFAHVLWQ